MRYNKQELFALASQTSQNFDREGVLILKERQDSFFRRSEGCSVRWFRLRGNLLFYLKGPEPWYEPLGVIVLGNHQVSVQSQDENGHWPFQIVWDNGVCYRMATFLESERTMWLKAMESAPYEHLTQRIVDLNRQLNDTRTMIDLRNYRITNKIINDFNEVPLCELSLSCDNLLCDANGNPPSPFAAVFVIFPIKGLSVRYCCTEVVERCSNPSFCRTVMFRSSDGITSEILVRIAVYDIRELVTQTGVAIGSVTLPLSHIQEAQRLRVPLLTVESKTVGFVTINGWSLEATHAGASPTHTNGERNSIDLTPKVLCHRRSQSLPPRLGLKLKYPSYSNLIRQNFMLPHQATYRFHSGLGGDITVHEAIAEPRFAFTMPLQLVDIYMNREKEFLEALLAFAEITKRVSPHQLHLVSHHMSVMKLFQSAKKAQQLFNTDMVIMKMYQAAKTAMVKYTTAYFKPSARKVIELPEDAELGFVPVNLHLQRLWVHNDTLNKTGFHDVMTVGAFSAHSHRADKPGGLIRLLQQTKEVSTKKADMMANTNRLDAEFEKLQAMRALRNVAVANMDKALLLLQAHKFDYTMAVAEDIKDNVAKIIGLWDDEMVEEALSNVGWNKKRIDEENEAAKLADRLAMQAHYVAQAAAPQGAAGASAPEGAAGVDAPGSACVGVPCAFLAVVVPKQASNDTAAAVTPILGAGTGNAIAMTAYALSAAGTDALGADAASANAADADAPSADTARDDAAVMVPKLASGADAAVTKSATDADFLNDAIALSADAVAVVPESAAGAEALSADATDALCPDAAAAAVTNPALDADIANADAAAAAVPTLGPVLLDEAAAVAPLTTAETQSALEKSALKGASIKKAVAVISETDSGSAAKTAMAVLAALSEVGTSPSSEPLPFGYSSSSSVDTTPSGDIACALSTSVPDMQNSKETELQAQNDFSKCENSPRSDCSENSTISAHSDRSWKNNKAAKNNRHWKNYRGAKNNRNGKNKQHAASNEPSERSCAKTEAPSYRQSKPRVDLKSSVSSEQVSCRNNASNKKAEKKKAKKIRRERERSPPRIQVDPEIRRYNLSFFKDVTTALEDMLFNVLVGLNDISAKGSFTAAEFEDTRVLMDLLIKLMDEANKWTRMAHTAMRIESETCAWTLEHATLQSRRDTCFSQALTTAAAGLVCWLSSEPGEVVAKVIRSGLGPLCGFEGLLSLYALEKTMWGDMVVAVEDLHTVLFKLVKVSSCTPAIPQVTGHRNAIIVELPVSESLYARFDTSQRHPTFTVTAVFFNIGINEKATVGEALGESRPQHYSNSDNLERLNNYYHKYTKVFPSDHTEPMRASSRSKPLEEVMENLRTEVQKRSPKNVEVLQLAALATRLMHGIRFTSCKSAKDRTGMAVTLEQTNILSSEYHLADHDRKKALDIMRSEGCRRENTLKNIGVAKYAFSKQQVLSLPEDYRPPQGSYGTTLT